METKLTGQQIREKFAHYFKSSGHEKVASSSLITTKRFYFAMPE